MVNTQLLDQELTENAFKPDILEPLVNACRNLVPNGTNHLSIAEQKLSESNGHDVNAKGGSKSTDMPGCINGDGGESFIDKTRDPAEKCQNAGEETPHGIESDSNNSETQDGMTNSDGIGSPEIFSPKRLPLVDSHHDTLPGENEPGVDSLKDFLPMGWKLLNVSTKDFMRNREDWKVVEGKTDIVLTQLPDSESNESFLKQLVRHCGMAMKISGVTHMFCNFLAVRENLQRRLRRGHADDEASNDIPPGPFHD